MLFSQVQAAAQRLRGHAYNTPVMTSHTLDNLAGAQVFLKCENFQRMGAFKYRGAYNAISQLSDEQKSRGVIAFSSGNHAQAVALVCKEFSIPAVIVMPDNAPTTKRAATEGYGAKVIGYDPLTQKREEIAASWVTEHGYTLIPPFDHIDVVLGQGTTALELCEAVPGLDMLLTPIGGGGLLSGSAIAAKGVTPTCRVIGIEPEVADDATQSFRTKSLVTIHNPPTIADGTRTPSMGKITFPLVLEYVDDMQTVSEASIKEAVRFLFYRLKLVVEPSGALGVAALLSGAVKSTGRVGVILSGGNIDADTMTLILSEQ
ncbi:MAG: threo-3-hydroxy-L-aspartate ammonia-lyase [Burkholderiales bacterium]|nr:threo-3-hydroxy-L-aspartate ammonia-lyase [Anaerolineae bacterium]